MKKSKLQKKYEDACNQYVQRFCQKQEMDFEHWVGDEIGGIAVCNDFFFNLHDIIWDINSEQPKELIIDWYYDTLDHTEKEMNYYSYTKGLRYVDVKN